MMKLKHNLCWSRPWWIIHEKLLHLWDYWLVCSFHCLNYLIPTFVTSNKSDLHANIHLWMVCCIKYQGYLAYQTLELPCFLLRKYKNTKMTKGAKKTWPCLYYIETLILQWTMLSAGCSSTNRKCATSSIKQGAMIFHREPASSFPAYNARHLL